MDGSLSDDWGNFARPGESLENFHEERAVKEESLMLEEFERRKEHDRVQVKLDTTMSKTLQNFIKADEIFGLPCRSLTL